MNKKCAGCGITMQNNDKNRDGYVDDLNKKLCYRCFRLKNYGEYNSIQQSNKDYKKFFEKINNNDLIIYVSSILNINLDYIDKFKNCILVITKRDIIPKSVIDDKIIKYIEKEHPKLLDIYLVISIHNYNIDNLYNRIINYNTDNVYFVGNKNSGKSTLLNKMIENYTKLNSNITTSMYPETTLDTVKIKIDNKNFIDTPGIINKGSITNYIDSKTLKRINPKKEIKPITYQLKEKGSLLIDNIVRIDYSCKSTSMTVYINNGIPVKKINTNREDLKKHSITAFKNIQKEDIVIEDLCFIKFTNSINLDIYTLDNVSITRRNNLI